ncbi:hypothetical protein D3C80_1560380 [compost metagenome]
MFAYSKGIVVRRHADRLVRSREHLAALLILYIDKPSGMMGIIRLLRLHEGFGFQIRGIRILRRLRLHKLGYRIPPAVHMDHHLLIPQEARGLGQNRRTRQLIILIIFRCSYHFACLTFQNSYTYLNE